MPPVQLPALSCPNCHSANTERLPFERDCHAVPVYTCVECGHVWREPAIPHEQAPRHTGTTH